MSRTGQLYEVKLRVPGDRLRFNGNKVEGGKIFSRHFESNNYDSAKRKARAIAKKFGSVIVSIGKVSSSDIIGDHKTWGLDKLLGIPMPAIERRKDVILDNIALDEIVFGNRKRK